MKFANKQIQELYDSFVIDQKKLDPTDLHDSYLGKNGKLKELLSKIKDIPKEQRAEYGKEVNLLKNFITEQVEAGKKTASDSLDSSSDIDPTAPFDINTPPAYRGIPDTGRGSVHPINIEMYRLLDIFRTMGFKTVEAVQLDNEYNMFDALNFPKGHPARDEYDTFRTDDGYIPPAHTSTMQNRILSSSEPPIRTVIPGRTFRNEATDASHEHTFYQIEGVYVDKDTSLANMLAVIKTFLEAFFEKEINIKLQPAFFPFTEPDLEFLISCPFCESGCSVCQYSGWMEVMGCGMIHPNVLKAGGIDPTKYTGFAWGFGLDRLVMLKHGIKDVRWFHSGDLRFLQQFNSKTSQ